MDFKPWWPPRQQPLLPLTSLQASFNLPNAPYSPPNSPALHSLGAWLSPRPPYPCSSIISSSSRHRSSTRRLRSWSRMSGLGRFTRAASISRSPTCSTHIYTLRSRTPLSPPESPQPCGGSQKSPQCGQRAALGWRHAQYRQGPLGRSEPAQEEGSSWCQQERLGTRGPCVTTQRAPQGRRKGCTYRLRTPLPATASQGKSPVPP